MRNLKLFHIPSIPACFLFLIFTAVSEIKAAAPIPSVNGPIPVTKTSYPFNAAKRTNQDLSKSGYVEEEFFVSGLANVYDFDSKGDVIVKTANAPYTTRILVRRPASADKFSGTVVVELLNPTGMYDLDAQWIFSRDHIMASNDIWVGITSKPVTVKALKTFDAERYKSLSWANPLPLDKTCPNPISFLPDTKPETENGLVWDIVSQVGALLKSEESPLKSFSIKMVLMTGYSQTGSYMVTYINFIRPLDSAKLANGKPVYDGYLIGDGDGNATMLNQCSTPFPPKDPRIVIRPCAEPVISIVTQTSVGYSASARRPDSDSPADRYRRYEVPGSSHMGQKELSFWPSNEDSVKAGGMARGKEHICEELKTYGFSDFPFDFFMNGGFANLKSWVQSGKAPVKVPLIKTKSVPDIPFPVAETDKYGNAIGGLRSPYVDVPVATYYASSTPLIPALAIVCWLSGYKVPFEKEMLNKLYPNRTIYINKVKKSVAGLVKNRLITEDDGQKIIEEAAEAANTVLVK